MPPRRLSTVLAVVLTAALASATPTAPGTPSAPGAPIAPAPTPDGPERSAAPGAGTREHRDSELDFTLSVPASWRPLTAEELDTFNSLLPEAQKKNRYIAGFTAAPSGDFGYPYTLVQLIPTATSGASWSDVERGFGADRLESIKSDVQHSLGDLVSNINLETPKLDRERARVIQSLSGNAGGPGSPRFRALSVLNLGNDRVVAIHSYEREEGFAAAVPIFAAIADSFLFDPGAEFVASYSLPGGWLVRSALIGAGIGLLVGLGAVLARVAAHLGRTKAGKAP